MVVDVIIHGKPNAGCSNFTSALDEGLKQNIINDFFQRRDEVKDLEAMFVDARYWKGVWYSVYTYRRCDLKELSDNVGRNTYFAISIVMPGEYCCLTSYVYSLLRKTYNEHVVGTFISRNGRYAVYNFDDQAAFNLIVNSIHKEFQTLTESFDNRFTSQNEMRNATRYSLLDCDSKAFINELRKEGRIIVTESEPSKDERLRGTDNLTKQYLESKRAINDKDNQINTLKAQLVNLKNELSKRNSSDQSSATEHNDMVRRLENEKHRLQAELDNIRHKTTELIEALRVTDDSYVPQRPGDTASPSHPGDKNSLLSKKNLLIGFALLTTIAISFLLGKCYGNSDNGSSYPRFMDRTMEQIMDDMADTEIEQYENSQASNSDNDPSTSGDKSCGISIYPYLGINSIAYSPIDPEKVQFGDNILFKISEPQEGYKFYTKNLKDSATIDLYNPFKLEAARPNENIIISYGSSEENINKENQFTFKPQQ